MNAAIIGAGYVGLVTGVCLASSGISVVCCDTDEKKIENLRKGILTIYEPKLESLLNSCISGRKSIEFTTDLEQAVKFGEILFITVNTPTLKDNTCDLGRVFDVVRKIAGYMDSYRIIVDKSTVPIGTGRKVEKEIRCTLDGLGKQIEFDVVSNPEFLREGSAVDDFMNPDRIIIGANDARAVEALKQVYKEQMGRGVPILVTRMETAEMIKYASNAFLATKVSFINEIANICELCGADAAEVAEGMGLDGRIGLKFLKPGPGYGGSCFPKDLAALSGIAKRLGYTPLLLNSVISTNKKQIKRMVTKIRSAVGNPKNKVISILGVAFKPETDDIREAPSVPVIRGLLKDGAKVNIYDPKAMENFKRQYPELHVNCCQDMYTACMKSDCVIIMTEWKEFASLDFNRLGSLVNRKVFLDLRNVYDPAYVRKYGFYYEGVGRL